MPSIADFLSTLHAVVLLAFVGVTAATMLVAVSRRLRIRRPLLVWQSGPFTRLPLGPSLFLVLVAGGVAHAWLTGRSVPLTVLLGYPAGGIFWFIATWMLQSVVVTEYGLVHDISRPRQAVSWSQVVDYFMTTKSGQCHVVFVYHGQDGALHRFSLPVPDAQVDALREIVQCKLDTRFTFSVKQAYEGEVIDHLDDRIDLS